MKKADQMKILRTVAPKKMLRPYCASCIQKGGSFTDWAKSAYNWVKDKVETVTNSDVYKAVSPAIQEYVLPILKEQAAKMFKEYTGMGKRGGSSVYSQHPLFRLDGNINRGPAGAEAIMRMVHPTSIVGKGLNVAGGSCCHGSGLRVAGRQDGGFIFSLPAIIAGTIAASKAAGLGAAGAAGAAAVNKIVGNGKKRGKHKGEGLKDIRGFVANVAADKAASIVRKEIMGKK